MGPRNSLPNWSGPKYSRRDFLVRSGLVGAGALSLPALLAACGGGSSSNPLFFENWSGYMDTVTVGLFSKETGIDFKYTEAFSDNKREITTNDILLSLENTVPISKLMKEDIEALRKWASDRARNASCNDVKYNMPDFKEEDL